MKTLAKRARFRKCFRLQYFRLVSQEPAVLKVPLLCTSKRLRTKSACPKPLKYVLCPMESSEIVDAGCERSESNFQCPTPAGRRHDVTDFHRKKCTFLLAIYIVSRNGTRMRFMPFSSTVFTQRTNARRAAVNAWLSMPRIGQSW